MPNDVLVGFLLGIVALVSIAIGLSLGKGWGLKEWTKMISNQPLRYWPETSNPENLQTMATLLPQLTLSEKQFLIVEAFGRPVRFVTGMDKSGQNWLEGVAVFSPEEGSSDFNFHYERLKQKDKSSGGIG